VESLEVARKLPRGPIPDAGRNLLHQQRCVDQQSSRLGATRGMQTEAKAFDPVVGKEVTQAPRRQVLLARQLRERQIRLGKACLDRLEHALDAPVATRPRDQVGNAAFGVQGIGAFAGSSAGSLYEIRILPGRAGATRQETAPFTCGACMATTFGVATFTYAPDAFFNLLNPFVAALWGFTGFTIEKGDEEAQSDLADLPRVARTERCFERR
jgi:hypothetical protein